ncbi:(deoxy)nucleoside triphosphate pyrophosphohydrolase [Alkalihalobacterium chitinilyticum]|uniref:8-oxo-dGTP diphosphatase n=1 Tax=Alkalihalobacterium chitinilyticum TaxID=2980103 RepID=A0ABT5VBN7_9BACI|nr:(deoxy)nucleoside triphosphate pyrophosphohydrolase [Alkalihalobacterium chitinilyticum]MDE5412757.1 (deoxy)nucleoside triphosphate pyrophosphohydrolase [Alkalihalobacterium chitinilyticum]
MKTIEVVGAVMINENNHILCALRSETMSMANYWEFPGGKIEKGENMEDALIREIDEELGSQIEVVEKITDTHHQTDSVIVHLHTYLAKIIEGTPEPIEHAELRWVPIENLHQLNWAPADIPTVDRLQQKML